MLRERKGLTENISDKENLDVFKTLYILIFSQTASTETIFWLTDLLSRSQSNGGAELLIRVSNVESEGVIVEIGANHIRLLEAAETLEITKEDKNGNIREFIFSSLDLFLKPGSNIDNLLSTAEKQRIILEEIMGIRSLEKKTLVGYPDILLYPGQSIIQVCRNNGIITNLYPLHELAELEVLKKKWTFTSLPISDIRNYFGESVAFYFSFIYCYTWYLLPPAIIGAIQTVISFDISRSYIFFAIFKMIWVTLFLEYWKRKSNELAYSWGTLRLVNIPKLHPTFRGLHMDIDPVTKQHVPVYPAYKRHFKNQFDDESFESWIITQLPGIIYAILVYLMNLIYAYVANILTEWENHRTQESFDNHRIIKLLLFEFVNNFIAMGYIAFYQQDLNMLKWQIAVMMIVNQLFNQFLQAVLPFLIHKYQQKWSSLRVSEVSPRIKCILEQRDMWCYEGTYDDYLEVFTQFGYVFLFSSVLPLAALLAIFDNILEVWMDGFKLCYSYQRPQARPVKGIGVWQVAFEVLSLLAVMSNCALICMSPIIRSYAPDMSLSSWLLVAVAVEHVIIAIKMILAYSISDVPKWVSVAIQKMQYESLKILKMERKEKTKIMMHSVKMQNLLKLD
ncbi:anoctamin-10 [Caerostris extrusa]|uniref:Anoctamin n=1 Tax=Caerostris extrusa TaxID=172846 RepID=A0AAV4SSC8_CAEEX|nr:anoctamin-10 [Caerostris extrusa]